jgi:hypothetical protein
MQKASFWTLNKLIVLLTLGGFLMLLMDLRFEHMDVLGDHWQAWIPLVYSAVMIVVVIWGLCFWEKGGRKVLLWAFAASIIVGLLGVWFHDKGKPWKSVTLLVAAWQAPIIKHPHRKVGQGQPTSAPAASPLTPKKDGKKEEKPNPPLAPLSFSGMGLLGMLACWKDDKKL